MHLDSVRNYISHLLSTTLQTFMDPHFPPEIWRMVFRLATFTATCLNVMEWNPNCLFSSSYLPDPTQSYESTLPVKKTLTLVSRQFYEMSIEFMFGCIQIFDTRHALLLADILQSHRDSPAKWIKHLLVHLGPADGVHLMDSTLITVSLPRCGNLTAFGWESPGRFPHDKIQELNKGAQDLMRSIPWGISALRWNRPLSGNHFTSLSRHTALRHLSIARIISPNQRLVILPCVTHLETRDIRAWDVLRHWRMPSVSYLKVNWYNRGGGTDNEHFGSDPRTIHFFPDSIRRLSIYIDAYTMPFASFLPIITPFPKLETFSYELDLIAEDPNNNPNWIGVHHPNLRHVGIHCRQSVPRPLERNFVFHWADFITHHIQGLINSHAHLPRLTDVTFSIAWVFQERDYPRYDKTDEWRFFTNLFDSLSDSSIKFTYES
ncbi:hypothetical protein BD410DRAFT_515161 [Rickenella mellea]|uniref:F-box domain-containing protein n=1 Tax=Rickenella mellea TaxID=50990 RepID=A0A4Y7PR44_9AGAM|nr:hypothetical protein BD410DRAFT_515161 [Rickenella mellea]